MIKLEAAQRIYALEEGSAMSKLKALSKYVCRILKTEDQAVRFIKAEGDEVTYAFISKAGKPVLEFTEEAITKAQRALRIAKNVTMDMYPISKVATALVFKLAPN